MKLFNTSKRTYMHIIKETDESGNEKDIYITLEPRETKDIPDEIAEIWLKGGEVVKVADEEAKDAEIAKLKAENEELKATAKKTTKRTTKK